MTVNSLMQRRVLVIGPSLMLITREALAEARLESASTDRGDALAALAPGLDLVLIDTDAASPELAREIVEALALRDEQPAVLLIGAHLPSSLVRAMMKLARSDVVDAPILASDLSRAAAAVLAQRATSAAPSARLRSTSATLPGWEARLARVAASSIASVVAPEPPTAPVTLQQWETRVAGWA